MKQDTSHSNAQVELNLYPDWSPPKYPRFMATMKHSERVVFASRLALLPGPLLEAEKDGLDQIIPLIVATGKRPAVLRAELGKAIWKQIHHSNTATNAKRARAWVKWFPKLTWDEILSIKPCHLHRLLSASYMNNWDAAIFAGRFAPPKTWSHVYMLYQDAERMGVTVNKKWSLRRLQREHDAAGLRAAVGAGDPTPWAEPFTFKIDGFEFKRLISDLDLAQEGFMQRHCIASYSRNAKQGTYLILRITGEERATLGCNCRLHRNRMQFSSIQIKGFGNSSVSAKCKKACKAALGIFAAEYAGGKK